MDTFKITVKISKSEIQVFDIAAEDMEMAIGTVLSALVGKFDITAIERGVSQRSDLGFKKAEMDILNDRLAKV